MLMIYDQIMSLELELAAAHPKCFMLAMQLPCKYHSAPMHSQPGPPMLFDQEHPDGVPNLATLTSANSKRLCSCTPC